jgi:hypothetical protein
VLARGAKVAAEIMLVNCILGFEDNRWYLNIFEAKDGRKIACYENQS